MFTLPRCREIFGESLSENFHEIFVLAKFREILHDLLLYRRVRMAEATVHVPAMGRADVMEGLKRKSRVPGRLRARTQ